MTTKAKSPYLNMIEKKRPWQAVPVDKGTLVEGSEATLFRALALRHLELPVREFLQQGLEKDLPPLLVLLRPWSTTRKMKSVMMKL